VSRTMEKDSNVVVGRNGYAYARRGTTTVYQPSVQPSHFLEQQRLTRWQSHIHFHFPLPSRTTHCQYINCNIKSHYIVRMTSKFAYSITSLAGNFGRLWKPGHESLSGRRILRVQGSGATEYLQGLVTSDLTQPPIPPREEKVQQHDDPISMGGTSPQDTSSSSLSHPPVEFSDKLRATCFLDNKGRIVTDSLLWKVDDTHYYIDVPEETAETLLGHLKQFVLRRTKVKVVDMSQTQGAASHVVFGTLNSHGTPEGYMSAVDPRHPSLGLRILSLSETTTQGLGPMIRTTFPDAPGTYSVVRKLAGIAEGYELHQKIAGETNQEFLNAVSFSKGMCVVPPVRSPAFLTTVPYLSKNTLFLVLLFFPKKGCYLGQELTARVQFIGAIRKRVMPIMLIDLNMSLPRPWLMASRVQLGKTPDISLTNGDTEHNDIVTTNSSHLSRLPRLSPSGIGSIIGMMSGGAVDKSKVDEPTKQGNETDSQSVELVDQSFALMEGLQTLKIGDKITDSSDGKTIGQIIAPPEPGTNVVLAQVRLDRVGLLGDGVWSHTNKVKVGELGELRYLPYLPLWWPEIDRESGKAKQSDVDDESDEDEELN